MAQSNRHPAPLSAASIQGPPTRTGSKEFPANGTYRSHRAADSDRRFWDAAEIAEDIAGKYEISALEGLIGSCKGSFAQDEISVAVLGHLKAGKNSFLNHFLGRPILPVGVVPVTAIVTEIVYGPEDAAYVHFLDGRAEHVSLASSGAYISERDNPENAKRVALIEAQWPELARFRGLKFVDTPGLESALAHNTEVSRNWLANVGLALVAIGVDPPLSERDVALLESLYEYTPNVSILVTKVDVLTEAERNEVLEFIRSQLAKKFGGAPRIFPLFATAWIRGP